MFFRTTNRKDQERAKRVQAICAEIRNTVFDNDGNAVGKYSDKNIIFDESGVYPIGKKLKDGSVVYFNIYKGKEKHEIKGDKDMENYIVINGKKTELTKEQLEKLGIKPDMSAHEKMFHRELHDYYYFINSKGDVGRLTDEHDPDDKILHAVGNYCKDEAIMSQMALHETLNRLLWRASVVAGELDNPWDGVSKHYTIVYDTDCQDFAINHYRQVKNGVIHFPSSESALIAIENIVKPFMKEHPDFVW